MGRNGYILCVVQFRFPRLTPTVKKLLIGLVAAFVGIAVAQNVVDIDVFSWLALDLANLRHGVFVNLLWQPFTYWFAYPPVPEALFSFLMMLLVIYFFLSPFEEAYGAKRTLQLSAAGIGAGALATILLALVIESPIPIAGASPIAAAAFGAFAVIARDREILFMFVVPMKVWHAILLGLGVLALAAILQRNPFFFVEEAAALGGGYGFARWMLRPRQTKKKPAAGRRRGPDLKVVRGGAKDDEDKPRWLN